MQSKQKDAASAVPSQSEPEPPIDADILAQAQELVRGSEVLPDGVRGLAMRLQNARKAGRPLRVKLGIDPTSSDLHLGHAVLFRKLKRFQDYGHQVVLIIGGFTAQIGDPSGRSATRPPLTAEQVEANAKTYLEQIRSILNLDKTELTNNVDWLAKLDLTQVLKLASSVTANRLLTKEAFGERLDKQLPVSFHELFYPLLQGYDSVAIKADIELGGTDQRFNILQGRELQPFYEQDPQMAMLLPILEGTDGVRKMSKTYDNYVGLKETPENMFGKCMRIPDNLIIKYFEFTTDLSGSQIDAIKNELEGGGNPKNAKVRLARQIVLQYWGEAAAEQEVDKWDKVHSQKQLPDKEDMPPHVVTAGTPLFRVLTDSVLAASSSEAKRLIKEGAVRLSGQVVSDANLVLVAEGQEKGKELGTLQVGRRKFCLLYSG